MLTLALNGTAVGDVLSYPSPIELFFLSGLGALILTFFLLTFVAFISFVFCRNTKIKLSTQKVFRTLWAVCFVVVISIIWLHSHFRPYYDESILDAIMRHYKYSSNARARSVIDDLHNLRDMIVVHLRDKDLGGTISHARNGGEPEHLRTSLQLPENIAGRKYTLRITPDIWWLGYDTRSQNTHMKEYFRRSAYRGFYGSQSFDFLPTSVDKNFFYRATDRIIWIPIELSKIEFDEDPTTSGDM